MFIICGDAHMLGIDDGSHGDFATAIFNPEPYPIFNAAALNQAGSYKGRIFSEGGAFPNPSASDGQFGLVQVIDTGGTVICIKFFGYRTDSAGDVISLINQYSFCREIGSSPAGIQTVQNFSASSSIYPNPSPGVFVMVTGEALNKPVVKIFDISGREVLEKFNYSVAGTNISFRLDQFSSGIYFVHVQTGNAIYREECVIAK